MPPKQMNLHTWIFNTWFLGRPAIADIWGLGRPSPQIRNFRPAQKPDIKNPSVKFACSSMDEVGGEGLRCFEEHIVRASFEDMALPLSPSASASSSCA